MLWDVKAAHQPLMVDTYTLPHSYDFFIYIIVIIFFPPMTLHTVRLLSHRRMAPRLAAARRSRCSAKSICLRDESTRWQAG